MLLLFSGAPNSNTEILEKTLTRLRFVFNTRELQVRGNYVIACAVSFCTDFAADERNDEVVIWTLECIVWKDAC